MSIATLKTLVVIALLAGCSEAYIELPPFNPHDSDSFAGVNLQQEITATEVDPSLDFIQEAENVPGSPHAKVQ